jgi:hypothetical protein
MQWGYRLLNRLPTWTLRSVPIEFGVTPPFVENCTLGGKVRERLAPKWTQLAISESSVTSPMISLQLG